MTTPQTTNAGILNVTGYVGAELARLLHNHPHVRIVGVTGRSLAGKRLPEVWPHLFALDLPITESLPEGCDVVFSALPHAAAAETLAPYIRAGIPVVDVSADFRIKDVATYEAAYKTTHPAPDLLPGAIFGLPELHRDELRETRLAAAPGCHSSGVILALAPLVALGLIDTGSQPPPAVGDVAQPPQAVGARTGGIIADTKTGLSGAGRALGLNVHFSEADENVAPYGLDGHRHVPEMTQELGFAASGSYPGAPPAITFVPHYTPMTRGILSTCYADLKPGASAASITRERLLALYREYYQEAPFVHISDTPPSTKAVAGTNYCVIHPSLNLQTGKAVISSVLDNLGKGASGAAVQCMNLMRGYDETAGLKSLGLFP